jgi:hypothetical protein
MNYGDDLIAIRTAQFWQAQGCEVIVSGFDASNLALMLQMHGVNAPAIASLWGTAGSYATMREAFKAGLSFTPDAVPDREAAQLLAFTLTQIDAIHFIGGGYINSTWPRVAFLLGLALAEKARPKFVLSDTQKAW